MAAAKPGPDPACMIPGMEGVVVFRQWRNDMNNKHKIMIAGVLLTGLTAAGTATSAFAEDGKSDEASEMQTLTAAKITAADAARSAAEKGGGVVSSVQIEEMSGKPVFHVEVVASGQQQDFAVDAVTGDITQMLANENDGGDGEDQD